MLGVKLRLKSPVCSVIFLLIVILSISTSYKRQKLVEIMLSFLLFHILTFLHLQVVKLQGKASNQVNHQNSQQIMIMMKTSTSKSQHLLGLVGGGSKSLFIIH